MFSQSRMSAMLVDMLLWVQDVMQGNTWTWKRARYLMLFFVLYSLFGISDNAPMDGIISMS